jgi:hypothetical protein
VVGEGRGGEAPAKHLAGMGARADRAAGKPSVGVDSRVGAGVRDGRWWLEAPPRLPYCHKVVGA